MIPYCFWMAVLNDIKTVFTRSDQRRNNGIGKCYQHINDL